MRFVLISVVVVLSGCSATVVAAATAGSVGAAAYSSYAEYAKATNPPDRIFTVPQNGRTHGVVYADDPRLEYWCADAKSRAKIRVHCEERERSAAEVVQATATPSTTQETQSEDETPDLDPDRPGVRESIVKAARKKGYTVDFDSGLLEVVSALRRGEMNLKQLKKTLVYVKQVDVVTAFQVLDQNNVLFRDQDTQTVIWLKGYGKLGGKRTWLEGADLPDIDMRYVQITGTKVYKTAIGTRQAIVIEPAF